MSNCPSQRPQSRRNTPAPVRPRRGFALESVLMLLVMFSVIILAGLSAVTSLSRSSNSDYRASRVSYAAEGGADDIMSQLDAAMQDGIINNEDIGNLQKPSMPGFTFTQQTQTIGLPVSKTITAGPFAGLYSLNQPIDIRVTARDTTANRATSILSVNAQTIPLFQFGVFYEEDLEIQPGQVMTFAGWVHTNGNLYLSSNTVTFQSQITTPDSVFWNRKNTNDRLNGVRINNAAGSGVLLDFDSRSLSGAAFVNRSQSRFNGRLMSGAHGVRPLKLPLPTNTPPVTLVEPRSAGDNQMLQDVKMAWKADWVITVNSRVFAYDTTTFMPPNVNQNMFCDSLVQIRAPGMAIPTPSRCRSMFKPRANAFYDGREDRYPDLMDVYMDSLRIWADSFPATRAPRIIYIEFVNDVATRMGATNTQRNYLNAALAGPVGVNDYMAVRLRGGAQLPKPAVSADTGGLTIVTNRPMYVLGDYNTTVWRPAALMADAVTYLSNPANPTMSTTSSPTSTRCTTAYNPAGWCDALMQYVTNRVPRPTTVNAAMLAGHSATPCDYARTGCSSPPYGGGLENFPRFLENWGSNVFTYTGSLVSLYVSRYATGLWNNTGGSITGNYYGAPTRNWQFDVNFRFPERLPPGTPPVGTVLQTAYRPIY
ncbi:MAG: hypothetical protein ACO1Q7_12230 [Gemmatimonas sp.]